MWILDTVNLDHLSPADRLWIIAQAIEANDGPHCYALVLRQMAERLEDFGWWLYEDSESTRSLDEG